jgi:hypothetical protein
MLSGVLVASVGAGAQAAPNIVRRAIRKTAIRLDSDAESVPKIAIVIAIAIVFDLIQEIS